METETIRKLREENSKLQRELAQTKENVLVSSMNDMKVQMQRKESALDRQQDLTEELKSQGWGLASTAEAFFNTIVEKIGDEGGAVDIDELMLMHASCSRLISDFKAFTHGLRYREICIEGLCGNCSLFECPKRSHGQTEGSSVNF